MYYFPCSFSLSFSFPSPPLHLKYWKSCLKRSRCLQLFGLVFSECSKSTVMLAVRSVLFLNCQLQLSKFREASCLFQYSTLPSSFQGVGKRLSPPHPPTQVCLFTRAKKQLLLEINDNATPSQVVQVLLYAARKRRPAVREHDQLTVASSHFICKIVKPLKTNFLGGEL